MKRITVWIDGEDNDIERVRRRLERFLSSVGLWYKIVDVCELIRPESDK